MNTLRPQGKINNPRSNASVPRRFHTEGSVNNLSAGQHLFLVVEIDGLMWPKGEAQIKNTGWTCEVHEGGEPPGGRFALSLFVVGEPAYEAINDWLDRGKATDDYPGLEDLSDGIKLHSIPLRLA